MTDLEPIRETVSVRAVPERAFDLFTAGMGDWWPVGDYSRAVSEFADDHVSVTRLEFQPRLGGAILEHVSDGRTLPWGEVVAWDPPRRVVMAWRPHALPEPPTELDVTFDADPDGTVVEVEHRGWERLSEGFRSQMYEIYVRGWTFTLGRFAEAANRAPGG
jgi:uncharacterized protein YndB with AHSA1/START domain